MLLANPLVDPLFRPVAVALGSILLAGLLLVLAADRRHLRDLRSRVLFQRWAVWAVIAPVFALAVLSGRLPMLLLTGLIVWQGLREYGRMIGLPPVYQAVLNTLGLVALPLAFASPELLFSVLPVFLIVGTLQPLLTQDVQAGIQRFALAAFGFAYLPLLLAHLLLVHAWLPGGPGILLVVAVATALSDVGAFTVGKLFGKHRLSPVVSPNKTWEGVAGNIIGAVFGTWLMAFALPPTMPLWLIDLLPLVVAIGAVWGDLLESLIKRGIGVKDAGSWLPGFGGLLDRADSLVVTVPLIYHLSRLVL